MNYTHFQWGGNNKHENICPKFLLYECAHTVEKCKEFENKGFLAISEHCY